ncbi:terminase large subunit [Bacillus thuringiensis]|uniref:terminase large subunit n=1 Tax=Bacillus thuringiensis TaxID=1428 RepID=UPI000A362312|nr:terminase large subunit [Bacillus thuringiensis]MED2125025.1 terminase large subunit [Bacillus thuringiensis]MED2146906.1 terminase large subunit [Bacillus thuringiensis]MED2175348.1 terminase large subunit [Bacillus thuringiensis]MED2478052.1 terminase large subunit [Bacillus thuringiensis]MED2577785.1 terminase large subunit [Bacillus thuringiensis]
MITTTSKPSEIAKWYKNWRNEQIQHFNILVDPSPELRTTWYAEQVVKGNIIASKKNVLSCQRHLNDLRRQGTEEFPWVFDEEKAHRPIRYIEKFCRPSKGDYKRLVLQPWQHFVIGSLYGWIHKDTGYRRFREGLIFIGRKNGKTTMISGLSNYAVAKDNEPGARVYVLANTKQQAGELFDESRAMVQKSPLLRKHLRENQKGIFHDKTHSKIEPRASDSKKLDGLNTHLGIFDEIHEFKNFKLINVIKKSRGARKQPMIVYITTAGYQLEGPLVQYYEIATDVLEGVIDQDRKFYFMAEMDSVDEIENPELWIKANPNMGVSLDLPSLIDDWNTDKHTDAEKNDWITKQFNIFVDNDEMSFVGIEILKRNEEVIDIKTLAGKECVGGYDLSATEDFTSACLEFPLEDGNVFVLSHSWVPQAKVDRDNENISFKEFKDKGWLTIIPGEYVYDWFVEQSEHYFIKKITYDPANAYRLNEDLKAYGFKTEPVRQGHLTLSPALKDVKELLLDGKIISNKNRLFRWYMNNVKLVEDRNGNFLPSKQSKYRKIDGFAAFLNAHTEVIPMLSQLQGDGNIEFISVNDLFK